MVAPSGRATSSSTAPAQRRRTVVTVPDRHRTMPATLSATLRAAAPGGRGSGLPGRPGLQVHRAVLLVLGPPGPPAVLAGHRAGGVEEDVPDLRVALGEPALRLVGGGLDVGAGGVVME